MKKETKEKIKRLMKWIYKNPKTTLKILCSIIYIVSIIIIYFVYNIYIAGIVTFMICFCIVLFIYLLNMPKRQVQQSHRDSIREMEYQKEMGRQEALRESHIIEERKKRHWRF